MSTILLYAWQGVLKGSGFDLTDFHGLECKIRHKEQVVSHVESLEQKIKYTGKHTQKIKSAASKMSRKSVLKKNRESNQHTCHIALTRKVTSRDMLRPDDLRPASLSKISETKEVQKEFGFQSSDRNMSRSREQW